MPLYFITPVERGVLQEGEAIELPDRDAVRSMAVQFASELLWAAGSRLFENSLEVRVTDEQGMMLLAITIAAVEAPAVPRP